MTLTIELPAHVEERLRHVAAEKGESIDEVVGGLARREALLSRVPAPVNPSPDPYAGKSRAEIAEEAFARIDERSGDWPSLPEGTVFDVEFCYAEE